MEEFAARIYPMVVQRGLCRIFAEVHVVDAPDAIWR